jgi:uncharacterized membrane protein YkvA (DUF1232 family)
VNRTLFRWIPPLFLAAATLLWVLSPLDPLPDVIPFLGWIDDLLAVVLGLGAGVGWVVATRPRDPRHVVDAAELERLAAPDLPRLDDRLR